MVDVGVTAIAPAAPTTSNAAFLEHIKHIHPLITTTFSHHLVLADRDDYPWRAFRRQAGGRMGIG